jgi:SAM-dependent methyltransferase
MANEHPKSDPATYDVIGRGYASRRVPDPRIAAHIWSALGDAKRICNVGAGTGSYEPPDREVVAVEPSREMIAQRRGQHRVVRARAESLPFADGTFDAAMALLTVHHWEDLAAGIAELRRIAPLRVLLTFDPLHQNDFWLVRDYLPEIQELELTRAARIETLVELLGGAEVRVVPIPWDCTDGFQAASWRRPEAYLNPQTRASISTLAMLPEALVERAVGRLAADLKSGSWARRNQALLNRDEMDYSYRLLVSREGGPSAVPR